MANGDAADIWILRVYTVKLLLRSRLDHLADAYCIASLVFGQAQPELGSVSDDVKHPPIGDVDGDSTEFRHFYFGVDMHSESRNVLKSDILDLAVIHLGTHRDQPSWGFKH